MAARDELEIDEKYYPHVGQTVFKIKHKKKDTVYTVAKSNDGYSFYAITCDSRLPKELQGKFLSYHTAIDHIAKYLDKAKMTPTAYYKERRKNAPKTSTKDS